MGFKIFFFCSTLQPQFHDQSKFQLYQSRLHLLFYVVRFKIVSKLHSEFQLICLPYGP